MKNNFLSKIFWIFILVIIWQAIVSLNLFPITLLPTPYSVFRGLFYSIGNGSMTQALFFSIYLILLGLVLGIALAVFLSILSLMSRTFESFMETCISIAHPLPGIALLPLIILWIGTDAKAIVFIIIHSVLWPLLLNLLTGFHSVPEIYIQVGQNLGLSRFKTIPYIYIPASMPYFLSGVKIAWARAWRALISAEMIFGAAGGIGGIGWLIYKNRVFMDTAGLFAAILAIVIIGILVENVLFTFIESKTLRKWGMLK